MIQVPARPIQASDGDTLAVHHSAVLSQLQAFSTQLCHYATQTTAGITSVDTLNTILQHHITLLYTFMRHLHWMVALTHPKKKTASKGHSDAPQLLLGTLASCYENITDICSAIISDALLHDLPQPPRKPALTAYSAWREHMVASATEPEYDTEKGHVLTCPLALTCHGLGETMAILYHTDTYPSPSALHRSHQKQYLISPAMATELLARKCPHPFTREPINAVHFITLDSFEPAAPQVLSSDVASYAPWNKRLLDLSETITDMVAFLKPFQETIASLLSLCSNTHLPSQTTPPTLIAQYQRMQQSQLCLEYCNNDLGAKIGYTTELAALIAIKDTLYTHCEEVKTRCDQALTAINLPELYLHSPTAAPIPDVCSSPKPAHSQTLSITTYTAIEELHKLLLHLTSRLSRLLQRLTPTSMEKQLIAELEHNITDIKRAIQNESPPPSA